MSIQRRQLLQSAVGAGIALSTGPFVHARGKARKYRTALIGSGWWGMNILREALKAGQTTVVAMCDVDPDTLETAVEEVEDLTNDKPKPYKDYRELLDKEKPEVVIIATPDHWHALQCIAALKSGAHTFIEKPTGHTIRESRAMVSAAKAADRTVQVGLHRRIGPHHVQAMDFLKKGNVGDVGMVRMFVHGGGGKELPTANSEPPEGMDWDMYCGPAPLRPFNRKIHPGGFRNFLDFANGTLGDWGVHWLDQLLWWTDEKHPRSVYSTGGRPIRGTPVLSKKEQTTDAPDSQVAVFQFESFTATWEHRKFASNGGERSRIGCYFYGTKGMLHIGWRDGWTFYPASSRQKTIHQDSKLQEPDGHNLQLLWKNFLDCIETRKQPVAEIEQSHLATNLSLLGMLSMKVGRSIRWDGKREMVIGDKAANQLLSRPYRKPWVYPS